MTQCHMTLREQVMIVNCRFFLSFLACIAVLSSSSEVIFAGAPLHEEPEVALSSMVTALREAMSKRVHDIDHVDRIITEYAKLKQRTGIDLATRKQMNLWLRRNCYYLGSKQYNHNLLFKAIPKLSNDIKFRRAFKQFVAKLVQREQVPHASQKEPGSKQKRIAILYSGCYGGGHRAPATALQQNFEKNGHAAQLIDIDVFINHYSPRVQGYTRSQIYPEIFQKEGNVEKARRITKLINEQHKPERRKYLWALKNVLADYQPDHIFAVAHHRPELSYLSYQLGVPMTYVHTDYHFNKHLLPIITEQAKLPKQLVKFSALTREPCFLKNLHDHLKVKNGKLPPAIQKQIMRLDFPVRDSFVPINEKEIKELRATYMIPEKAVVCKLAVGQNPFKEEIRRTIMRLVSEEKEFQRPIYLFVICGSNTELKIWLEKCVHEVLKKTKNLFIDIRGFLDEKEMAKIDQIATVWITKPGGSTCAELVQMRKQMLYVFAPHHVWEHGNALYLQCLGLASPLSSNRPIHEQVKSRLYYYEQVKKTPPKLTSWKKQSLYILDHCSREWDR